MSHLKARSLAELNMRVRVMCVMAGFTTTTTSIECSAVELLPEVKWAAVVVRVVVLAVLAAAAGAGTAAAAVVVGKMGLRG